VNILTNHHNPIELTTNPALKQKRWWGSLLVLLGGAMILVGMGYALLNIFGDLLPIILGIFLAYVGVRLLNRGKRHFVPVGLDSLQKDTRPPILYLRPFSEEGALGQISHFAINRGFGEKGTWRSIALVFRFLDTYEQYIGYAFRKIGPLVAIGNPTDGLPHLGAYRIYVGQQGDWQQMVSTLASQASYALLQIGSSDGLMWEVQYIVNHVRPQQLVLCLPNQKLKISRLSGPKKREQKRQEIYQAFRDKTQGFFPKPLPADVGRAMFIYFDQDWNAKLSLFRSEPIFQIKSKQTQLSDPKLEALNWLNSALY
jgi:hypothetical protein